MFFGLALEIELLGDHLANLVVVGVEPLHRNEHLHDGHDPADGLEIEPRDLIDVLVLHLDRDASPVEKVSLVYLTERSAGQRTSLEPREHLIDRTSEIGKNAMLDVLEGPRRNLILQAFEPGAKLLREEVGHDAEQLADLDEEPLELDNRSLYAQGIATVR